MFLSKIWFILVGLLAGAAVTAAFVAPRPADRHIEQLEGQRLDRAQYAAEQMLKNDARRWIDYVAKLGRDAHLTEALDASSRGAGEPRALHETVRSRLRALVPDRAAIGVESLIAVDNKGRVVARVGDDEGEYGESIAGAEVVSDALRGYLSDDVWGAAGRLRRVGAAPVTSKSRDRIVGAVVVAVDTGKRLAEMWKRNLNVDVAIVLGKNVVSSTLAEALLGQLPELIDQHANEIANHKRTRALSLDMGNKRMLLVAAPFVGEASEQRAYYVLLNEKSPKSDPWVLLSNASSDDLRWTGDFPWVRLALGILAMIGIGLFLQRIEVEGPIRRLRSEVHSLARNEIQKIDDTRYGGKLGGVARDINATVERFTHAPPPKSETAKKDIAAILDRGGSADGKSFDVSRGKPAPPAPPPNPASVAASLFGAPKLPPPVGGAAAPIAVPAVPAPGRQAAAAPAGSLARPVSLPTLPSPLETTSFPSGEFAAVSPSSIIETQDFPSLRKDLTPPPVPVSAAFAAPVAATFAPPPPPAPAAQVAASRPRDAEMEHFQQVFEEYLALRAKCGEPTASVAADKFFAKLQSNRDQLIAKYSCRTARFSVYVKDGKAAIKATPVRG
jgi:Double sensory domain of two-component sensor kinase